MHETNDLIYLALLKFAPHAMGTETRTCPKCGHEDMTKNYTEPPTKQDVEDWLIKRGWSKSEYSISGHIDID